MELTFKHSGKMGDVIMSLPFIKCMGGARTFYQSNQNSWGFNEHLHEFMKPLLETQEYIGEVKTWANEPINYDLDEFRSVMNTSYNDTMPGAYFVKFNQPIEFDYEKKPWVTVPDINLNRDFHNTIIISRTPYLHGRETENPVYKNLLNMRDREFVFLGTEQEHDAFENLYQCKIEYYPVSNALEIAIALKQSGQLFANQSLIYSIAESLKITTHLEKRMDGAATDCMFRRNNLFYI